MTAFPKLDTTLVAVKNLEKTVLDLSLSEEEKTALSSRLLQWVKILSFPSDGTYNRPLFNQAQDMGIHVLPVHFYSPVPDTRTLSKDWQRQRFSGLLNFQEDQQLELVEKLSPYFGEAAQLPNDGKPGEFFWNNGAFAHMDASAYYSIIRYFKPNRIVEIGCGNSSLLAAEALKKNQMGQITCIEPYPNDWLRNRPDISLIEQPIQNADLGPIEALSQNDILFIDSSHVFKANSDVNDIFFRILPKIRSGVLIHFHDIFLPDDFPAHWMNEELRFWNEQFMLLAFLLGNRDYDILLTNHFLGTYCRNEIQSRIPPGSLEPSSIGGGSFWLRKK